MEFTEILAHLRAERERINQAIAALKSLEGSAAPATAANAPTPIRRLSAAGRKRIAEAARKRWAAARAAQKPTAETAAQAPAKKKSRTRMSPAAKKRLSESAKKRWAAKRTAAGKA